MKKRLILSAIALSAIIAAVCLLTPRQTAPETEDTPAVQETSPVQAEETEEYRSSMTVDKAETVYAKADADGTVTEITVETQLRNPDPEGEDPIADYSLLTDIRNTESDEELIQNDDGNLLWENHGHDISYKGTSDAQLPVTVRIQYFLDGQPIDADSLAGQSGQVTIRFDYENQTLQTAAVPFLACTMLVLPSDQFSDIDVTNGRAVSLDDQTLIVGFALPGLSDNLSLTGYEPTEDIEIPESVEITANVTEFELDFTATVISSGILEDLESEQLDDLDQLIDDMEELKDASSELADGISELFDGVEELQDGVQEYTDGVGTVNSALSEMTDALDELDDQKTTLREAAQALQNGLAQLNTALTEFSGTVSGDPQTEESLALLQSSVQALAQGSSLLAEGIQSYTHYVSVLYRSAKELQEGSDELSQHSSDLNNGILELLDGVESLRDGMQEFDEEGIQKLADLAGDDLAEIIRQIRTLKTADADYQNFGGICDGQTGSVRFIIETETISF